MTKKNEIEQEHSSLLCLQVECAARLPHFFFLEWISNTYHKRVLPNDIQNRTNISSQDIVFLHIFLHAKVWDFLVLGNLRSWETFH